MTENSGTKGYNGPTYKELLKIARERKIKYFIRYNKNELEKILGFEISKPNEKYENQPQLLQ